MNLKYNYIIVNAALAALPQLIQMPTSRRCRERGGACILAERRAEDDVVIPPPRFGV